MNHKNAQCGSTICGDGQFEPDPGAGQFGKEQQAGKGKEFSPDPKKKLKQEEHNEGH